MLNFPDLDPHETEYKLFSQVFTILCLVIALVVAVELGIQAKAYMSTHQYVSKPLTHQITFK